MGRLLKALTARFDENRFEPPSPILPADGWINVAGHFRFGYPWPWQRVDDPGDVIDTTGDTAEVDVICGLVAPRHNGSARLTLWRSAGSFRATVPTVDDGIRSLYGTSPTRVRRILLAGVEALVIEVPHGGDHVMRLIAHNPREGTLHGQLSSPAAAADGYRAHLETMLGTWSWH